MGGVLSGLGGGLMGSLGLSPASGEGGFTLDTFDPTTGARQMAANDQVQQDMQAIANKSAELTNNPGELTQADQSSVSNGGQTLAAAGPPQDSEAQRDKIMAPLFDDLAQDVEARQTGTTDV